MIQREPELITDVFSFPPRLNSCWQVENILSGNEPKIWRPTGENYLNHVSHYLLMFEHM